MASSLLALRGSSRAKLRLAGLVGQGIVACAALLLVPGGGSLHEQQTGSPGCELEPVTLPLFGATPAAIIAATPASVPVGGNPGPAPDAATIEAAIEVIVACVNIGDPAVRYAVFTDRYLAEQLADPARTYQPAFEQQLDSGVRMGAPRFGIESIEQCELLDDGRVSVVVTLSADGARYRDRLVLADVDGVWLIDEVETIDPATTGAGS